MDDTQAMLGELRRLRSDYDEIAMHLRIDTFWIRMRDHVRYGLAVVRQVPLLARLCLFCGVCLLGFGVVYRQTKAVFLGVDMLFLSLLFVGTSA